MKWLFAFLLICLIVGNAKADNLSGNLTTPQQILLPNTLWGRDLFLLPGSVANGSESPQVVVLTQGTDAIGSYWSGIDDGFLKQPSPLIYPWYFILAILGGIYFFADDSKILRKTPFGYKNKSRKSFYSVIAGLLALFLVASHYADFSKILFGV